MSTDNNLVVFKAIANFTQALSEEFGKKQHSLALYCRLINKTTLAHDAPIKKHISSFTSFCISNRDAITSKDHTKLVDSIIKYSDKVFINMKHIFNLADSDTQSVIWSHLLTISALVDSSSNAKEILKSLDILKQTDSSEESDFLSKLMEKIESHIDPNATPMQAMASIMSSGILGDLIGGMNSGLSDGSLNLPKIMASVQKMITKMSSKTGNTKGGEDAMNMINGLMGMMGGAGAGSGGAGGVDMASMMQGLMGAMANGAAKTSSSSTEGEASKTPGIDMASMMQGLMGSIGGSGGAAGGSGIDMASMIQGLVSSSMAPVDEVVNDSTTSTIQEITRETNKDLDIE